MRRPISVPGKRKTGVTRGRNKPRKYPKAKPKSFITGAGGSNPIASRAIPLAEKDLRSPREHIRKAAREYLAMYDKPSRGRNVSRRKPVMRGRGGTFKGIS